SRERPPFVRRRFRDPWVGCCLTQPDMPDGERPDYRDRPRRAGAVGLGAATRRQLVGAQTMPPAGRSGPGHDRLTSAGAGALPGDRDEVGLGGPRHGELVDDPWSP